MSLIRQPFAESEVVAKYLSRHCAMSSVTRIGSSFPYEIAYQESPSTSVFGNWVQSIPVEIVNSWTVCLSLQDVKCLIPLGWKILYIHVLSNSYCTMHVLEPLIVGIAEKNMTTICLYYLISFFRMNLELNALSTFIVSIKIVINVDLSTSF